MSPVAPGPKFKVEFVAPATAENQAASDYEAAIGKNRGYYLPRFEEFDRGGPTLGWHWPAFFVTTPWFLYRKMWLIGILNVVYPFALLVVCSIASAFLTAPLRAHPAIFGLVFLLLLAAPWFLLPIVVAVRLGRDPHPFTRPHEPS